MVNSLYAGGPGSVSLDFREDGHLVGLFLTVNDLAVGAVEVSFNSSSSFTTNDTSGVIGGAVLNAAGIQVGQMISLKEPISVGERIFLHLSGAGNICRVFLYTDGGVARPASRRR
jgi:hypothetical protein